MTSRKYTSADITACRRLLEAGADRGHGADIAAAGVSADQAARLRLLRLVDGPVQRESPVAKLSGLGVKVARDAQRQGVA